MAIVRSTLMTVTSVENYRLQIVLEDSGGAVLNTAIANIDVELAKSTETSFTQIINGGASVDSNTRTITQLGTTGVYNLLLARVDLDIPGVAMLRITDDGGGGGFPAHHQPVYVFLRESFGVV